MNASSEPDHVAAFILEKLELREGAYIAAETLFGLWCSYASAKRTPRRRLADLVARLNPLFPHEVVDTHKLIYLGLCERSTPALEVNQPGSAEPPEPIDEQARSDEKPVEPATVQPRCDECLKYVCSRLDALEKEQALLRALVELGALPKPEAIAAPPATVVAQPAKRKRARRTRLKGGGIVLPSIVFEDMRAAGISDTDGAHAIGIPRSTWSRTASGKATETGLDNAQFASLDQLIKSKIAQLEAVKSTLELYGVA